MSTILIDAGASKTDFQILHTSGQIKNNWQKPGGSLTLMNETDWVAMMCQEIKSATAAEQLPERVIAGVSGLNSESQIENLHSAWQENAETKNIELIVVNDAVIGLLSGSQAANGLVLIAGTGTNCWGINESGQTAKAAGIDYFADQGGGWDIGWQILRTVFAAVDGRFKPTALIELIAERYEVQNWADLARQFNSPSLDKAAVAQLADLALSWQEADPKHHYDQALQIIIRQAVDYLVLAVRTVMAQLSLDHQTADLVLIGGVVKKHSSINQPLQTQLRHHFPQLRIIIPTESPIYGAQKLAELITDNPERAAFYCPKRR